MATYKGIQGYSVQTLASDPSPTQSVEGQLWFNSTSSTYKIAMSGTGAWAAGTNMTTLAARGAAGPTTATIQFGGKYPTPTQFALTETYDGSTWTEVADLNTARNYGCPAEQGTQTAAFFASGTTHSVDGTWCESYNGTCWSEVADTTTTHAYSSGAGTSTASLAIGKGPAPQGTVESWNGSAWSEVGDLNTGRYFLSAAGTQTAGLAFSGEPNLASNESWNGTTWTEVADLTTPRQEGQGCGIQTAALMVGGKAPPGETAKTEKWNGSSWTEVGDLATARKQSGTSGSSSAGITAGGMTAPTASAMTNTVEIFSDPVYAVKTVTTS